MNHPPMRTFVLATLLLTGCLKPTPALQAPSPVPVALTTTLVSTESTGAVEVPAEVTARFAEELTARNLVPTEGADVKLVVATEARFSVQVNGRYRWNVDADIQLVPAAAEEPLTTHVSVPVALVYAHQTEVDALTEASPLVARRVGTLLDTWLSSDNPQ